MSELAASLAAETHLPFFSAAVNTWNGEENKKQMTYDIFHMNQTNLTMGVQDFVVVRFEMNASLIITTYLNFSSDKGVDDRNKDLTKFGRNLAGQTPVDGQR